MHYRERTGHTSTFWPVVTLSKGSVRTLARIHTPRDRADGMTGEGMAEVARVIIALVESRA